MPSARVGLQSLGRYPLSLILCYLEETEGTSLLITSKRYFVNVLPLFRRHATKDLLTSLVKTKWRHHFIEYSAQDAEVLLQRLNTRRLKRRVAHRSRIQSCYAYNKTTRELALSEPLGQWPAHLQLLRFLTKADKSFGVSLLVSYPRSGNSLLRNLLERLSGIVTGSDNRPDRKLSKDLATIHDLVGEGVTRQIHVVKTHYPERRGIQMEANRAILLVRNPYDAIDSYWNMNLTNTHTETVTDIVYAMHQSTFQKLALNEIKIWIQFQRFWLEAPIPVLVVRFEDLILEMERELSRIASFLHMNPQHVLHACDNSTSPMGVYRPRSIGKRPFGKSLEQNRYSQEMIDKFHSIAEQEPLWQNQTMLQCFGYDIQQQDFPNNFWNSDAGTAITATIQGGRRPSMHLNCDYELRAPNDPFGRSMKQWRLDHTDHDRKPFPIVEQR